MPNQEINEHFYCDDEAAIGQAILNRPLEIQRRCIFLADYGSGEFLPIFFLRVFRRQFASIPVLALWCTGS